MAQDGHVTEDVSELITDEEAEAQFAAGYEAEVSPAVLKTLVLANSEPVATDATGTETVSVPTEVPAASPPVIAQVTDVQLQDLIAKANRVDELHAVIEKLRGESFGRLGQLQDVVKQLQTASTTGAPVEISEADLQELKEEYPDIAGLLTKGLARVLAKKPAGSAAHVDVQALVDERVAKERADIAKDVDAKRTLDRQELAIERLTDRHEDWREVVGAEDSTTPFRQWLAAQPADYAKVIHETWDPRVMAKALDKFKAGIQTPVVPPSHSTDPRTRRLAEAVQPKGGQKPPRPTAKTPEEEFEEGFAGAR